MHKIVSRLAFCLLAIFTALFVTAQDMVTDKKVEMADGLRADGKIYVVVAVLLTILLGIVFYLISLDRKISKFEKEV